MADSGTIGNAVKLVGEIALVPGTSQLLDGNIKSGAVHAALGLAARAVFGLPGLLVVAADSFLRSVSDRNLYDNITEMLPSPSESTVPEAQTDRTEASPSPAESTAPEAQTARQDNDEMQ